MKPKKAKNTLLDPKRKKTISIQLNEVQIETFKRLCVAYGLPGVPLSNLVATACGRGLALLVNEIPHQPVTEKEMV